MKDDYKSVLRLPKRHSGAISHSEPADGQQLVDEQSLRQAVFAGLIIIIIFSVLWAMLSTLLGRVFPWMTLVLGMLVGLAVRRAGRGLDWRFTLIAAMLAAVGALVSNIVVAAAFTAHVLETDTLTVLRAVTSMTWPVFFDEAMSWADLVYGLFAAAIAAFYANRRLGRAEYLALRQWQQEQTKDSDA